MSKSQKSVPNVKKISIDDILDIKFYNKAGLFSEKSDISYQIKINEGYESNHDNSLITRADLNKCYNSLQQTIKDLNKHINVDACLDLGGNSLTDTSDLSLTGKSLDMLVNSCKTNLKPLTIVIVGCNNNELNGLWKLTPKAGKFKNIDSIPTGCCYVFNDKVYLKKSHRLRTIAQSVRPTLASMQRNSLVQELDHDVQRMPSDINKIKEIQANLSISIVNHKIEIDYLMTTVIDQSNTSETSGIFMKNSDYVKLTAATMFSTINAKKVEASSGIFESIRSNTVASDKINTKKLYINGNSIESRLEEIEAKIASLADSSE